MSADLSVIVPSVNGWDDLSRCLAALSAEAEPARIELIVVDRLGDDVRRQIRGAFPAATVVEVDRTTPIPAMRFAGIDRASAPLVAIIEDHVLVPRGWAGAMVAAARRHGGVVGGAVIDAPGGLVDRAAFLSEYSEVVAPQAGPTARLTGNNTVYPRELLNAHRRSL